MEQLTAAHRTLPFNSLVLVENRTNGKSIQVRINDRGPFVDGRVIDLSRSAAAAIDMIGPGTAPVLLRLLGFASPPAPSSSRFTVQAGSFLDRDRAEALRQRLASSYSPVDVIEVPGDPTVFRVLVGDKQSREQAGDLLLRLRRELPDSIVVTRP
jgi:rare lipoprotein A